MSPAQIQIQQEEDRKKRRKKEIKKVIIWTLNEFAAAADEYYKSKERIIKDAAKQLEKIDGVKKEEISTILATELKGVVSQEYLIRCLGSEYKNQYQSARSKAKKSTDPVDKKSTGQAQVGGTNVTGSTNNTEAETAENAPEIAYETSFEDFLNLPFKTIERDVDAMDERSAKRYLVEAMRRLKG